MVVLVESVDLGDDVGAWFTGRSSQQTVTEGLAPTGNLSHYRPHRPADLARDRQHVAEVIGQPVERWHLMRQVHGARVAVVDESVAPGSLLRDVDAAVTTLLDRPLVVTVADCVPVVAAGPTAVGVAHAGRQGVVEGVAETLIEHMVAVGNDVAELQVALGPSIRGCCYEVPRHLHDEVVADRAATSATTTWGTPSLDLASGVAATLAACGVNNVVTHQSCTACDPEQRWFSHRRDRSTGRFAGIVVRQNPSRKSGT